MCGAILSNAIKYRSGEARSRFLWSNHEKMADIFPTGTRDSAPREYSRDDFF